MILDNIDACDLQLVILQCNSMRDLFNYYGLIQNGSNYRGLVNILKDKLNINHKEFFRAKRFFHSNRTKKVTPKSLRKAMIGSGFPYCCSKCNLSSWLDKEIRLDIDHIDGNNLNNNIENLRFLCPNCHRQTPTYAMNKKYLQNN